MTDILTAWKLTVITIGRNLGKRLLDRALLFPWKHYYLVTCTERQSDRQNGGCVIVGNGKRRREGRTRNVEPIGIKREKSWYIWVFVRKMVMWLFKIFEIQKGRTFSFNDILRLCTIVIIIAIRSRA